MSPSLPGNAFDRPYQLSGEQIRQYQHDGHILLRGVATRGEVDQYRPSIERVLRKVTEEKDSQGRTKEYGRYFLQVTNLWHIDAGVRQFVFARRFARIAAELMGVKAVRLYHDQALFKPAGGKPTPWHQDQVYWPLDTTNTITMWMPLVNLTREMGTMVFASASHHHGPLTNMSISPESDQFFADLVREKGYPLASYALDAGDATFHSGWTAHAARANSSDQLRGVMTIIYYADGTRIMEPDNEFRKVDMEVFHPGQEPGDLAASELNPVLFAGS